MILGHSRVSCYETRHAKVFACCTGTGFSFVWLFGAYRLTLEFFTHMEKSPLPVKGCKFWLMLGIYGQQWGLFSVPHCNTGHPFIMVISEHPWHLHLLLSVWPWSCPNLFLRLRSVAAGIQTPNLPFCEAKALVHRALVSALNTTIEHICMFISKGTECRPWWVFVLYLIHCICILLEYTSNFIHIIGTYRGRSIC